MDKREPETVAALTARIKHTLEQDFSDVRVEGELSNVKIMSSGHAYFSLKDADAQIACAFFSMTRRMPPFTVKDGVKVRITGDVSVYPPRGGYQVIVRAMEQSGVGDLMMRFEALKQRLREEGCFDAAHKRPLPVLPQKIGIVTSPTGAAIRDMLNVIRRRFADIHIIIAPARVQGAEAVSEIVNGIQTLNRLPSPPDVIIVGRGGGSIEDLWCFNEEAVARAIYDSAVPVISAVGHEVDYTIADFVADLRAPTPSAAAELVVGRKTEFENQIANHNNRLHNAMRAAVERAHARISIAAGSHVFRRPETLVRQHAQQVDLLTQQMHYALECCLGNARERLNAATPRMTRGIDRACHTARLRLSTITPAMNRSAKSSITTTRHHIRELAARLDSVNPGAVLARGYAIVKTARGTIARRATDIQTGEILTSQLAEGVIQSIAMDGQPPGRRHTRRTKKQAPEQQILL